MEVDLNGEKEPVMLNRRHFIAAAGAIVLAATSAYAVNEFYGSDSASYLRKEPPEAPQMYEVFPIHDKITTTVFWIGEDADPDTNDGIHNSSSVWVQDWVAAYGGIDNPDDRCNFKPCGFEPKENPFYFALPFSDYGPDGPKSAEQLKVIPWFRGQLEPGESVLKNRWIEILYQNKKAYAQWEDAGPFGEDDTGYVFGDDQPQEPRAGLDVSPAVADYLGIDGRDETAWRFVDESVVPSGPWREIITVSGPQW